MSRIGYGYGSDWHLLRWMGRHRQEFDKQVLAACGEQFNRVDWLDFESFTWEKWLDVEIAGLNFLPMSVSSVWEAEWPQSGKPLSWDAVGTLYADIAPGSGEKEWLLVEAKAHARELASSCAAGSIKSKAKIKAFLGSAKDHLGVPDACDWMNGYYQQANRIAMLSWLVRHGVPARLLFIYFIGEKPRPGWTCPTNAHEWRSPWLDKMHQHLGLPSQHPLSDRIVELFLPLTW